MTGEQALAECVMAGLEFCVLMNGTVDAYDGDDLVASYCVMYGLAVVQGGHDTFLLRRAIRHFHDLHFPSVERTVSSEWLGDGITWMEWS